MLDEKLNVCVAIHRFMTCSSSSNNSGSITIDKEQVSSPSDALACSPSSNNSNSITIDREQPSGPEAMYRIVEQLVAMDASERRSLYRQRHQKMLSNKIDCAKFLTWFIENYPKSVGKTKNGGEEFWSRFK